MNSSEKPTNQPSAECQRELDNARNALKRIINDLPREKLRAMNDPVISYLVMGCDGDVDEYVRLRMGNNAGNAPDVAAFHVAKNLILIKKWFNRQK